MSRPCPRRINFRSDAKVNRAGCLDGMRETHPTFPVSCSQCWARILNIVLTSHQGQPLVPLLRKKSHELAVVPKAWLRLGPKPRSPADFRDLDRASLQSDPVAAATLAIKRATPDSVKGWFVTKLLTPYLVSTGCGKPGKASTRGNDWASGGRPCRGAGRAR